MEPAGDRRGSRDAIGIFDQGRRCLKRTMLDEVSPQGVAACDQAVVGIRKGEHGKKGDRPQATFAQTTPNANPVVVLIMSLFAPAAMADDRIG